MSDHALGGTNVERGVVEAEGAEEAGVEQEGNGANPGGGPHATEEVEAARGCAGVSGGVEVDETRTGSAGSAAEPARVSSGDAEGGAAARGCAGRESPDPAGRSCCTGPIGAGIVLVASKNSRSSGVEEEPCSAKGKADSSKVT